MRSAVDNPFSPGSDVVPNIWAGRVEQLSDWRDVVRPRRVAGLYERGRTILGEPGTGKSSLVRRIARDAVASGDWVTPQLRIPSGADPLKLVAGAVLRLAEQAGIASGATGRVVELLRRVETVAASGFSLTVRGGDGPEPFTALYELLVEVGRAAVRQGNAVLIHVDEVQNITDERALSQLLIALGDALTHTVEVEVPGGRLVERHLPIAVYLTGLPDFEDMAGARKGAAFARRFRTSALTALGEDDLRAALQPLIVSGWVVPDGAGETKSITLDALAADAVVQLCCGEPFLFQLAGERAWYAGSGDVVTADEVTAGWRGAEGEASSHVERVLARLPQKERTFVDVMAAMRPEDRTLTRIAREMGEASAQAVGPTAQRLDTVRGVIERGKPYSFRNRAVEAYLTSDWPRVG
ncbi:ATP-binding protein [Curtobacterium sp. SP.BCp]|uniref:ATP-binding protein n=1 Tax=Curtobacterium sp. SP.BCp TaxID=3435230 RepID=UPI003F732905